MEETRVLECSGAEGQELVRGWARTPLPVTATCHVGGHLHVRLSGPETPVREAAAVLGGERGGASLWNHLRDRALPCFERRHGQTLWEIVCPPAAPLPPLPARGQGETDGDGECVIEWAGARRWWSTSLPDNDVRTHAAGVGGRASPAYGGPVLDGTISTRLKRAFDPDNVLNPGIVDADAAA